MSDPITPQTGQPVIGIQEPGQDKAIPQAAPPVITPVQPTESPTAEQVAQWRTAAEQAAQTQQQLQEREQQLQQATESAKYFQGQTHRLQQALGANPQPPAPEPWRLYADELIKEKVSPQEAEIFARSHYRMVQQTMAPLQQELAGYRNAHSIEPAVKTELDRIFAASPQLFAQPGTYDKALQDTMTAVQQGMNVDATFVRQMTVLAADALGQTKPPQTNPAQPMPQIFANGVTRPTPGYHPAQPLQNQPQLTADQQKADAFIREQFKIPTT